MSSPRVLAAICFVATTALATAATSSAYRPASGHEHASIVAYLKAQNPSFKLLIDRVRVSTVNPQYAAADMYILPVGKINPPAQAILHHHGRTWHVLSSFGPGTTPCDIAPRRVLHDLGFVECETPTHQPVPTLPP